MQTILPHGKKTLSHHQLMLSGGEQIALQMPEALMAQGLCSLATICQLTIYHLFLLRSVWGLALQTGPCLSAKSCAGQGQHGVSASASPVVQQESLVAQRWAWAALRSLAAEFIAGEIRVFPEVHVSSRVWIRLGKVTPGVSSCSFCVFSCRAGVNDSQAGPGDP